MTAYEPATALKIALSFNDYLQLHCLRNIKISIFECGVWWCWPFSCGFSNSEVDATRRIGDTDVTVMCIDATLCHWSFQLKRCQSYTSVASQYAFLSFPQPQKESLSQAFVSFSFGLCCNFGLGIVKLFSVTCAGICQVPLLDLLDTKYG